MTRDQMIELLIPSLVHAGDSFVAAHRRAWRMSVKALERELLLRGLTEYDDPVVDSDDQSDDFGPAGSLLGWREAPVYAD